MWTCAAPRSASPPGDQLLRGATIDGGQLIALAPLLARHLGITVTD